jgi:Beta-propeller repeat
VAKVDAAGHQLWVRQLGTADGDNAKGVATDGDGNVYLTGYTDGSLGGANQGYSDAWVAKYSTQR